MSGRASAMKRSVIGFCVAFGNMFLAHGLFFVFYVIVQFFMDIDMDIEQIPIMILLYALQLALNIVLHFTVLKKQFQPVKEREPLFYFLLTVTAGVVWTGAYFIFNALFEYDIIDSRLFGNSYLEMMLGFQPLLMMFTIAFSVIYYTRFRKRVGELFYFYTFSIMLIGTVPMPVLLFLPPFD